MKKGKKEGWTLAAFRSPWLLLRELFEGFFLAASLAPRLIFEDRDAHETRRHSYSFDQGLIRLIRSSILRPPYSADLPLRIHYDCD